MNEHVGEDLESSLYNQWSNFSSSGQWDRAKDALGQLLSRDPDNSWLHCKMGDALYHLSQNQESEIHFKKSITLEPDNGKAFQGLAFLYFSMGRAGSAEDHCRKALQLDPDDIDNWVLMVHLCLHFEDSFEATNCLQHAEAINANDNRLPVLRTRIGAISKGASKLSPNEQIAGFREALSQNPENAYTHYQIGWVQLEELRDYQGAEESFRQSLRLKPRDKDYQEALMRTLRKRDPVLKILWSPFTFGMWIFEFMEKAWDAKWPILIFIFTWKYLLVGGVALWLIFFTLFWPIAKVYERLTLVEVHKKMGLISLYKGPMRHLHRLSFPVRILLFFSVFIAFWSIIVWIWLLEGTRSKILSWAAMATVGGVVLLMGMGIFVWIRDDIRERRRRKKNAAYKNSSPTQ